MKNGNWHEHHQGVAFYSDGTVADGQHRLYAIIKSGISIQMMVTFDVPKESAIGIDVHRARRTDDVLRITGRSEWIGKNEAAIIKKIMMECGLGKSTMSPSVVADFGERHKEAIIFAGSKVFTSTAKYLTSSPIRSAIACAYAKQSKEELMRFAKVLTSGVMDSLDDVSAIRLRERLLMEGQALSGNALARARCMKFTMRSIKAFCDKERISKLVEPANYVYPILK